MQRNEEGENKVRGVKDTIQDPVDQKIIFRDLNPVSSEVQFATISFDLFIVGA